MRYQATLVFVAIGTFGCPDEDCSRHADCQPNQYCSAGKCIPKETNRTGIDVGPVPRDAGPDAGPDAGDGGGKDGGDAGDAGVLDLGTPDTQVNDRGLPPVGHFELSELDTAPAGSVRTAFASFEDRTSGRYETYTSPTYTDGNTQCLVTVERLVSGTSATPVTTESVRVDLPGTGSVLYDSSPRPGFYEPSNPPGPGVFQLAQGISFVIENRVGAPGTLEAFTQSGAIPGLISVLEPAGQTVQLNQSINFRWATTPASGSLAVELFDAQREVVLRCNVSTFALTTFTLQRDWIADFVRHNPVDPVTLEFRNEVFSAQSVSRSGGGPDVLVRFVAARGRRWQAQQ